MDCDDTLELRSAPSPEDRERLLAEILLRHEERLHAMARLRLDPRLARRIDPTDVVQEVFLDAARRIDEFLASPPSTLFLWLRFLAGQRLCDLHRYHLGAQARDARREIYRAPGGAPEASTIQVVGRLLGDVTTPSVAAMREERRAKLIEALEAMDPLDREVIVLRSFEGLTNVEAAHSLEIEPPAASKRYVRALDRLRILLETLGVDPNETAS